MKTGALIGVDKYGNKYFEDKKNYFFGEWISQKRTKSFGSLMYYHFYNICFFANQF